MTTINFRGKSLTVRYVDPSLGSGANDGTTPADAFRALPLFSSLLADSFYLIRRTGTTISWQKSTNSNNNIQIYGMPFSNEGNLYDKLPTEVKTAWGSDVSSKVTILLNNTSTSLQFDGNDCGIFNIDFKYHDVALTNGVIRFANDQVIVDSCTINVSGQPISGSNTITNAITPLYVVKGDGLTLKDTTLTAHNSRCLDNASSLNYLSNVNVDGCTFYSIRGIGYSSYQNMGGLYFYGHLDNSTIKNCQFKMLQYGATNNNSYPNTCYFASGASNSTIKSITVDTSATLVNSTNTKYDLYVGQYYSIPYNSNLSISDFTITSTALNNYYGMYIASANYVDIRNVTINLSNVAATTNYGMYLVSCAYPSLDNINVSFAPNSSLGGVNTYGLYAASTYRGCLKNSSISCGTRAMLGDNLDIYNCNFMGNVSFGGRVAEINTLTAGVTTVSPLVDLTSTDSYMHIQTINAVGAVITPTLESDGVLIVDNMLNASPTLNPLNAGRIYVNNEFYSGFWRHQTPYIRLLSSNVSRISGAGIATSGDLMGYSIRSNSVTDPQGQSHRAGCISPKPFSGMTVETSGLSLGEKTATMYIATKFLSSFTPSEIWFELEVPKGSTGSNTTVLSTYGNCEIEVDTSIWSGESGLSYYKLSIPFTLERAENCYARIYYNKFSNLGYTFIEPRILIS